MMTLIDQVYCPIGNLSKYLRVSMGRRSKLSHLKNMSMMNKKIKEIVGIVMVKMRKENKVIMMVGSYHNQIQNKCRNNQDRQMSSSKVITVKNRTCSK